MDDCEDEEEDDKDEMELKQMDDVGGSEGTASSQSLAPGANVDRMRAFSIFEVVESSNVSLRNERERDKCSLQRDFCSSCDAGSDDFVVEDEVMFEGRR